MTARLSLENHPFYLHLTYLLCNILSSTLSSVFIYFLFHTMLLGFLSYLIGHSRHTESKTLGQKERKKRTIIIPSFNWFQTFSPPGRPVFSAVAKTMDTDAKPIKFHCKCWSYELMLEKLLQLIGILRSSGHKSQSFRLDKVVSCRLLFSLSCIQLLSFFAATAGIKREKDTKH